MSKPAQQNDSRTVVTSCRGATGPLPPAVRQKSREAPEANASGARRDSQPNPGAERAKENEIEEDRPCAPGDGARSDGPPDNHESKRLSATDISALASMKNVAKCDTWCELQNPVNHRVFERKLRPKPSGRGHVCLGVTQRCPTTNPSREGREGRMLVSRESHLAVGPNACPRDGSRD